MTSSGYRSKERSRRGFERKISHRLAFEAVLFRARTGCPWRDLPGEYGDDQALGRSRGGLSTKIHTVAVSESQVLGLILTGGQAGDAPVGEEMLAEVLRRAAVNAVDGDRAYDSDAIRALIAVAGKEAMIPPRSNRRRPADYDREKYKGRNKVERLFNRLKGYRAIATRYDTTSLPPCSWAACRPPSSLSA